VQLPYFPDHVAKIKSVAGRVPNQRLHRTAAEQPPVAPRLPVSRGAVSLKMTGLAQGWAFRYYRSEVSP